MANDFNFNTNKQAFNGDEFSQTTVRGNFSNDAMTMQSDGVPSATSTPTTFTVTFTNSDNAGTSATYTAQPFETIGNAITEKSLTVKDYAPTYYYNQSIVGEYTIVPIKSDITIDVKWTKVGE